MLDHWYFRKIFQLKQKVYLLNSSIKQDLSVYGNFEENISFQRYVQLINAEYLFIKESGSLDIILFKIRLFLRLLKQINYKNKAYFKFTLSKISRFND